MDVLFNKKLLEHNPHGKYHGSHRLKGFLEKYLDTAIHFDPMPYITKVHAKEYITKFEHECKTSGYMAEVFLSPASFECAVLGVGLTIKASETGNFAVVSTGGHHAGTGYGLGFCFFNNDAIVVKALLDKGRRVALLDIDGHRGDGTQDILENEPDALLISLHQKGAYGGDGDKFSNRNAMNFALSPRISEQAYMAALKEALTYINDFSPDIVGICAGFDTFKEDALLKFDLEIASYWRIGRLVAENQKNIFAFLAGGYHDKILECVESFVNGVNNMAV
jgi:acetoin utilization deacetylase AcuC-like enzyme